MDPIHWFLDGKEDIRSSYYLEDVATDPFGHIMYPTGHIMYSIRRV